MKEKFFFDLIMEAADKAERRKRFDVWVTSRCRAALLDHQRIHGSRVAAVSPINSIYDAAPEPNAAATEPSHMGGSSDEY
jgi:hypothetical protein